MAPAPASRTSENFCAATVRNRGGAWQGFFQDDGYTGLNMDRPDFQKMLGAVERGMFDVILTKDLSRLGRNYLQTGQLIEEFFPRNKVRYIALNDAVDTNIENDITPFRNILKNMFCSGRVILKGRKSVIMRVCGDWLSKAPLRMMTGKSPILDKSILFSRENANSYCVLPFFDLICKAHRLVWE